MCAVHVTRSSKERATHGLRLGITSSTLPMTSSKLLDYPAGFSRLTMAGMRSFDPWSGVRGFANPPGGLHTHRMGTRLPAKKPRN